VIDGETVGAVLAAAEMRYGPRFSEVLRTCRVWVNGSDATTDSPVQPTDEVAVLPPVSGGCA
jgi:molybdopterin converting factor small subunit